MRKRKLLTSVGQKFGNLTVTEILDEYVQYGDRLKRLAKCLCDCGKEKVAVIDDLRNGQIKSCGCLKIEKSRLNIVKANQTLLDMGVTQKPKIATAKRIYRHYSDEDLTFEDFLQLSQMNCFYCGQEPKNKANAYINGSKYNYGYLQERIDDAYFIYNGLDRVDNALGHFKSNVVPCCYDCNKGKMTRSQQDFFDWVERIYNLHCKNK